MGLFGRGHRNKMPTYTIAQEFVGDMVITDHSARFREVQPLTEAQDEGSRMVAVDHLPGTRRLVDYSVGRVTMSVEVCNAHPDGDSLPSAVVAWDSVLRPSDMLVASLDITPSGQGVWEFVDFGDNWVEDGVDFVPLTLSVVEAATRRRANDFYRLNDDTMSVIFQDVNGSRWRHRPEVVAIIDPSQSPVETLDRLLAMSLHPDLVEYLPAITAREPEIFPH